MRLNVGSQEIVRRWKNGLKICGGETMQMWTEVSQEQRSHYQRWRRMLGGGLSADKKERKRESKNSGKCHSNNACCRGDSFMLSKRRSRKHKRRRAAASHSESVFPLHQAARRGGVVSPGGRTRADKRKTSRLCLASLSAFPSPLRRFRQKEPEVCIGLCLLLD